MARKQLGSSVSSSSDAASKSYVDGVVNAVVAYNATGAGTGAHSGTISWSHTASGTSRVVIVAVATGDFTTQHYASWTTSCTYDGVAMTSLGALNSGDPNIDGYQGFLELFYMFNPPTGTKTIQASSLRSGNPPQDLTGNSVSYTGVMSLSGLTQMYDNATTTNFSIPSAPNTYTFVAMAAGDPITSSTRTQRYEHDTSNFNGAGSLVISDAVGVRGPISFSATSSGYTDWATIGLTLYPMILESDVVHLGGDESIAGEKSFTSSTTFTKQIWVQPAVNGGSAALTLDNDNGQVWQETNNNGGTWALYDSTHSRSPIAIQPDAPDQALLINGAAGVAVKSAGFTILDTADTTKWAKFDTSAVSTGTTNIYKLPDSSTTLIGASGLSGITVDTTNEPAVVTWNTSTSSQTTASFTPQAGTYVLVFVGIGTNQPTSSATVADSGSNAFTKLSSRDTYDSAEIWGRYYATSPGSITITATLTNAVHGGALKVRCLLGASPVQAGATANAGDFNQNVTITPTQNNSLIYGVTTNFDGTNLNGTQLANTTPLLHYSVSTGPDDINFWRYNGVTSASSPITVGYAQNGNRSNTIAFEVTTNIVGTGTVQTLTNKTLTNPTITNYTESVVVLGTVTTASTISLTAGTVVTATLTASTACAFTMPSVTAGKSFSLYLKQPAVTGNGSATFSGVKWSGAGVPIITTSAGKMDILSFVSDGTNWYGSYSQGYTY